MQWCCQVRVLQPWRIKIWKDAVNSIGVSQGRTIIFSGVTLLLLLLKVFLVSQKPPSFWSSDPHKSDTCPTNPPVAVPNALKAWCAAALLQLVGRQGVPQGSMLGNSITLLGSENAREFTITYIATSVVTADAASTHVNHDTLCFFPLVMLHCDNVILIDTVPTHVEDDPMMFYCPGDAPS